MVIPESISISSLPLLFMGGLLLWSGLFFASFSPYLPRGNLGGKGYLYFGLTALAFALFAFAGAAVFSLPHLPEAYFWNSVQFFFSIPLVVFFILFSVYHLEIRHVYFRWIFPLIGLGFCLAFVRPSLMLHYEIIFTRFTLFGIEISQPRMQLAPLGIAFILWAFVNAVGVGIYWLKYLKNHSREYSLMLGFFLFLIAGSYDAAISFNFFQGPNLFVYGFSGLLAGMAWRLLRNVNEANQIYRQKTKELEKANNEIRFLVGTISHDILAPLVSIHGFTDLLLNEKLNDIQERQNYLERIRANADHMTSLLNDLAAYQQLGRVEEEWRDIDWALLIQETFEVLNLNQDWPRGKVEVGKDWPSFFGSPKRIKQMLMNLIQNAFKYSDRPDVVVRLHGQATTGGIIIRIEDNGPGIPETLRERIFETFYRNHPQVPGTGMGLAIVKKIVESYRGRVWVDPDYTGGTAMTLYLATPFQGEKKSARFLGKAKISDDNGADF